jgi:tetratricopeptide (TPR) repeat protein
VLPPLGLVLVVLAAVPSRGSLAMQDDDEAGLGIGAGKVDKRVLKKSRKQAAAIAKKGDYREAGELLFSVGEGEQAAQYFIKGKDFVRAAEIRHDQNRFVDSAELYLKAGRFDSAGTIFAQQEDWARAADCYLKDDRKSTAGEMFEKAEKFREAGDCYREVGFMRHAAQAYVKCKSWGYAATCLEEVYKEESMKGGNTDPKKQAELTKLVHQAAKLHQRAGDLEKSLDMLEKGGCNAEAGELAMKLQQFTRAAELYRSANDLPRAAEAMRSLGEDDVAARIMGEHHRDQGDVPEAARQLEEAGDLLEAGDMYRQIEDYLAAGRCYREHREFPLAAEMFKVAGERETAAECYELGKCYEQAAECWALLGRCDKEADLLASAGEHLRAGEVYHREGIDEQAITALQKVQPEDAGFTHASALLGDIFQARGQLSLAIKKLRQAIGQDELGTENLPVFYRLAGLHESNGEFGDAVELYEKIMTFDYHYEDVEQRLVESREHLASAGPMDSHQPSSASARGAGSGQPGRYQVIGELGRGGMGIVYKAKDTSLDRIVAYKVLPDSFKENPQALKNFMREAKAAAKLNHPGIVTVFDTGEQDGRYYIAMEYVDGTSLKEILRRRGVISPAGILHVMVQICEALAYAHEKKVIHRDIKPANAMWTRDKKAKIMDFGLAKIVEEVRNHTTVVSGTPYYMSPEQTLGKNVDHRTDIYSLGVMIFELATGTVPFREGNIPYHHVHTPPPDVRDLRPDLPAGLAAVVGRCIQKDPSKRYQSAREILAEVKASLSHSQTRTQHGS